MDYYGGYADYRHSTGGTSAYHHSYSQQPPGNATRYGPAASYRNGITRSGAMYDGFDRFGYQGTPYAGYNATQYGYNHTPDMRQNNYYNHPYTYDPTYRAMAPSHTAYPYHHRDPYANDAMYRSKNNYVMRDTPYQYGGPGGRDYSCYGGMSREFYASQQSMTPTGPSELPATHHNMFGSTYPEYNQNTSPAAQYPTASIGYPSSPALNSTGM